MALRGSQIFGYVSGLVVTSAVLLPTVSSAPRQVQPNAPTTFTVNSTADTADAAPGDGICDSGGSICTLRAAMEEANANAGADTIHFAIGNGPQTIAPATGLPALNETVTIDGTTQPGYSGTPLIQIDGVNLSGGSDHGIPLSAGSTGSTVKALLVNRFPNAGIVLSDNSTVENCLIGTDATRTQNRGNGGDGVAINGISGCVVRNNVIAFNGTNGVGVYDTELPGAYPEWVGLPVAKSDIFPSVDFTNDGCGFFRHAGGTTILANDGRPFRELFGMRLTATMSISMSGTYTFNFPQAQDNARLKIDGDEHLNLTQSSDSASVFLSADDHQIQIDYREGNSNAALVMQASGPGSVSFTAGGNPGFQAQLYQLILPAVHNTISQNSIFDNGGRGIALGCCCFNNNDVGDLDLGANDILNHPDLTNHFANPDGTITIQGVAKPSSIVEVFGSTNDSSGRGEGKLYLTSSAPAANDGTFIATFNLPQPYYSVTTTATENTGNTSEFSPNHPMRQRHVIVTNLSDSGPGSLRNAMSEAMSDGVSSLVTFDSSLSGQTIFISSPLPLLNENWGNTINGDLNSDCKPDIAVQATGPVSTAFTIHSDENTIRGLALGGFNEQAILIEGAPAQHNTVVCNYIGTNLSGTQPVRTGAFGIRVQSGAGYAVLGDRNNGNLITTGTEGIRIDGSSNCVVRDNTIGLDANGNVLEPPQRGIQLIQATANFVGDGGNRIVATAGGIDVAGGSNNTFAGNHIGWPEGTTPLGPGIRVHSGAMNSQIGGTNGAGNRIENNGGDGIRIEAGNTDGIAIRGNSISKNGTLGIDLDGNGVTPNDGRTDADNGANDGLNFPVLTRAHVNGFNTIVEGVLDVEMPNLEIDFFASSEKDPSGYGEGQTYLGTMFFGPGPFSATFPSLPAGTWITATAHAAGNSSEFSLAVRADNHPQSPTELTATPIRPNAVLLRWRDPQSNETGFRIERRGDGQPFFGTVTNLGPDATTFTDTTTNQGQTFTYRVIATTATQGLESPPSNEAAVTTYTTNVMNICRTTVSEVHRRASDVSVAHDGTNWALAWADQRESREDDIYFRKLAPDGTPTGAAINLSNDDMPSKYPTLVWNGTQYGLLWFDHVRQPNGEARPAVSFAMLDANGTRLRGDLKFGSNGSVAFNPDGQMPLIWDGGGWGIFTLETHPNALQQVYYYRVGANGDLLVNGVPAFPSTVPKGSTSVAWSGTDYGVTYLFPPSAKRIVRMAPNGTANGSFIDLAPGQTQVFESSGMSTVWDGSAWAVVWSDRMFDGSRVVSMSRVSAAGTLISGPTRLSDDGMVVDEDPKVVLRPGGGFLVFVTSTINGVRESAVLRALAGGGRDGSRFVISPQDGFSSQRPRVGTNGTNFLAAWEESSVNVSEIAAEVVENDLSIGTLQNITNDHAPPAFSLWPSITRRNDNGFVGVWAERHHGANQIVARIQQGNGNPIDKRPLTPGDPARPPAMSTHGPSIALAWTDRSSGALRFRNFNFDGDPIAPSFDISTGVDVDRGVALDWNGTEWGLVWSKNGSLQFQRSGGNTTIGAPVVLPGTGVNASDPRLVWLGYGWVLVWSTGNTLQFTRLDPAGALLIPPTPVVHGAASDVRVAWNGQRLGVAWSQPVSSPPSVLFTTVDSNGIRLFEPIRINGAVGPLSVYADDETFHIVYQSVSAGIRDVTLSTQGQITSDRFLGNHGEGDIATSFNGANVMMLWEHQGSMVMQSSHCVLSDTTPPSCPPLNTIYSAGAIQSSWPAASDPQSGILAYHVYRDGRLIEELGPHRLSYTDSAFTPGATHTYQVRPFNGAYLEATNCTARTITAGIVLQPATLPNARQNQNYNQTITASQGSSGYTFAVTAGSLPANVTLNTGNGTLTGTPNSVGLSTFTVTATDNTGATGSRSYNLRVCAATTISPTIIPDPLAGAPYQHMIMSSAAGSTFSVTGGALPAGLALAPCTLNWNRNRTLEAIPGRPSAPEASELVR